MHGAALSVLIALLLPSWGEPARAEDDPISWGMMGGWSGVSMSDLHDRGVRVVDVSLQWRLAEPQEDRWDESYFAAKREEIRLRRRQGFRVVLNFGLHHAPDWMLERPAGRFVDQDGAVYEGSDEPQLVWAPASVREEAQAFTAKVFRELGTRFAAVRVGGGHWGELTYPSIVGADGHVQDSYWAFDENAQARSPVPGWRPCDPAPNGEATAFLRWYLRSLTRYQNRQIRWTRRAGYRGTVAVLYASWGMRAGDFGDAAASRLCGTTSAEVNGEVQRGFAHARHIRGLRDGRVAAWGTWAEREGTLSWLARLAVHQGIEVMGENAGHDGPAEMATAIEEATSNDLTLFMWVRAEEAYCRCDGYATIEDYERLIRP